MKIYILILSIALFFIFLVEGHAIEIRGYLADSDNTTISLYKVKLNGDDLYTYAIPEITKNDNETDTFIFRDLPAGRYRIVPLKIGWWFIPPDVKLDAEWGVNLN